PWLKWPRSADLRMLNMGVPFSFALNFMVFARVSYWNSLVQVIGRKGFVAMFSADGALNCLAKFSQVIAGIYPLVGSQMKIPAARPPPYCPLRNVAKSGR